MRRRTQSGQAIILVVLAVGLVLMGALGLAIDTGQLYGHRQMAQAAADAAAEAAVVSIYGGTNTGTNAFGSGSFTCTTGTDARTPCRYARMNGFGLSGSSDVVDVNFPGSVSGVTLSSKFTPPAVHVLISRPVPTTLLRLLGASVSKTVKAAATAAIVRVASPIPIVVLHPTLTRALSITASTLKICGGPQMGLQVNSSSSSALFVSKTGSQVDLTKAGPADTARNCTTGTGADFGVFGGLDPTSLTPADAGTGHFYQPNLPMPDALADVSPPSRPASQGTATATTAGTGDCPASATNGCTIYTPGYFPTGIQSGNVAIFNPGVYYIEGKDPTSSVGFGTKTGSDMIMCSTTCLADTSGCCRNNGMLVYLTSASGTINVTSNVNTSLVGSDQSSSYKGLLFFGDRDSPSAAVRGPHILNAGAGTLTLQGTTYLTNTTTLMNSSPSVYQQLRLTGGGAMLIKGEIIVSKLELRSAANTTVQLDTSATSTFSVDQVALVN